MQPHQLEAKVLGIVERVLKQQPIEDDLVELKTKWPPHTEAARHIAGHANAAFGQPILWIIGIDERSHAIPGADENEFANWWGQVKSCFSELEPKILKLLNVPTYSVTVVAILIETDRAPYVVKNPAGGTISREVTYRANNAVHSATREQLLRILATLSAIPTLDFIDCEFAYYERPPSANNTGIGYSVGLHFCILQPQDQRIFVAAQRINLSVISGENRTRLKHIHVGKDNETLDIVGSSWVHINGSGPLQKDAFSPQDQGGKVTLRLELSFATLTQPVVGAIELNQTITSGEKYVYTYRCE